jgi:hypothetical protein
MRIAGVTGANQAGLAVIERGGRIGALRSGHEPEQWLLDDLPRQKDLRPSFQAHGARWHDPRQAGIPLSTFAARNNARRVTIRAGRGTRAGDAEPESRYQAAPPLAQEAPLELPAAPTLEHTVRARHRAGHSQRAIARELNLDRRKVKRILDQAV